MVEQSGRKEAQTVAPMVVIATEGRRLHQRPIANRWDDQGSSVHLPRGGLRLTD
jgi:hypothetical protein